MDKMFDKENIKPGHKFRYSRNELYHIVTSFFDNDEEYIVIKSWNRYKGRWSYEVTSRISLEYWFELHQKYESNQKEKNIKKKKIIKILDDNGITNKTLEEDNKKYKKYESYI